MICHRQTLLKHRHPFATDGKPHHRKQERASEGVRDIRQSYVWYWHGVYGGKYLPDKLYKGEAASAGRLLRFGSAGRRRHKLFALCERMCRKTCIMETLLGTPPRKSAFGVGCVLLYWNLLYLCSCRCGGLLLNFITQRHAHPVWFPWTSDRPFAEASTCNTNTRQTSMTPAGFETPIPATELPQMYALDRLATGMGSVGCVKN